MLVNTKLSNKKLATPYGNIEFNQKGESQDLTKDQQKDLGKLKGFKYVEEKEEKKESPKGESKEEPKETTEKKPKTKKKEPSKDKK